MRGAPLCLEGADHAPRPSLLTGQLAGECLCTEVDRPVRVHDARVVGGPPKRPRSRDPVRRVLARQRHARRRPPRPHYRIRLLHVLFLRHGPTKAQRERDKEKQTDRHRQPPATWRGGTNKHAYTCADGGRGGRVCGARGSCCCCCCCCCVPVRARAAAAVVPRPHGGGPAGHARAPRVRRRHRRSPRRPRTAIVRLCLCLCLWCCLCVCVYARAHTLTLVPRSAGPAFVGQPRAGRARPAARAYCRVHQGRPSQSQHAQCACPWSLWSPSLPLWARVCLALC
jgi:hypothetical protein